MTRSEMILEFIDGSLGTNDEQALFDELARQPELRAELRQFISIGEAVRADREAFMPPAYVEQALMAGIGLAPLGLAVGAGTSAGAGAAAAAAGVGVLGKLAALKGLWVMIAAFVAGAVLAGGSVYVAMNDGEGSPADRHENVASAPSSRPQSARTDSQAGTAAVGATTRGGGDLAALPQTSAAGGSSHIAAPTTARDGSSAAALRSETYRAAAPRNSTRGLGNANAVNSNAVNSNTMHSSPSVPSTPEAVASQTTTTTSEPQLAAIPDVQPVALQSAGPGTLRDIVRSEAPAKLAMSIAPTVQEYTFFNRGEKRTFTAELRKQAAGQFFTNSAHVPTSMFFSEDFGAALYWRASDNLMLGAEGGSERYSQTLNFNDTLRIEQRPNIAWAGLTMRYVGSGDLLVEGVHPYLQITGGFAFNAGPIARARLGFEKDLITTEHLTIGFNGALEASSLVYTFGGQALISGRYGATLGLQFGGW